MDGLIVFVVIVLVAVTAALYGETRRLQREIAVVCARNDVLLSSLERVNRAHFEVMKEARRAVTDEAVSVGTPDAHHRAAEALRLLGADDVQDTPWPI